MQGIANIVQQAPIQGFFLVGLVTALLQNAFAQSELPAGHAHNDYEHARPLFDALANGFTSIEADVWLRDGELLIGHDENDLGPERTLESLYLDPLRREVTDGGKLILLVDIKTDGEATYSVLSEVLSGYSDILKRRQNAAMVDGPVTIIVSGNRPLATMLVEDPGYAFYDGRISDLDGDLSSDFMPLVSDNWTKHFSWTGAGEMPDNERQKLADLVEKAHAKGYALRFWGTPDKAGPQRDVLWTALAEAGVDFINTDDLSGFAEGRPPWVQID